MDLEDKMSNATHLAWGGTGGSMVPQNERNLYYAKGEALTSK